MADALADAAWKASTYSNDTGGSCVEVADVTRTHSCIGIRDSKNPAGPALLFTPDAFTGFITGMNEGRFNRS
ncbi:DUF397 domain-containing protein [Streptomyces daliensis]|uniref:DUF397 domain-containing protein n=1 Tax=Streptomyces daliensis TaxID=299421 RepID=A0A8T4IRE8_9ACTN|nr:DUF397 domain-containing protein [Streptomyces daliensis]